MLLFIVSSSFQDILSSILGVVQISARQCQRYDMPKIRWMDIHHHHSCGDGYVSMHSIYSIHAHICSRLHSCSSQYIKYLDTDNNQIIRIYLSMVVLDQSFQDLELRASSHRCMFNLWLSASYSPYSILDPSIHSYIHPSFNPKTNG